MEYRVLEDFPRYKIFYDGTIVRSEREGKNGNILQERKIYPVRAKNGYRTVRLINKDGKYCQMYLHRLIYQSWVGNIPHGYEIDHIDGDRSNNQAINLRAITHMENCANKVSRDRYKVANAIEQGKYDKDRLARSRTKDYYENLIKTYQRLKDEYGYCGVWMLMKQGHCGYPRSKRIISEMEGKNVESQW